MRFPTLSVSGIDGRSLTLPRDFSGRHNIVIVAFAREQLAQMASWHLALDEMRDSLEGLAVYQLFVVPLLPYWFQVAQDVLLRRMVAAQPGISTFAVRTDLNDFNRALDIPTVASMYTLLADAAGEVLWRSQGPCDTTRYVSLKRSIRKGDPSSVTAAR